jgi:hypothetical protein
MDPGYPVEDVCTTSILAGLITYVFVIYGVLDRPNCHPHG